MPLFIWQKAKKMKQILVLYKKVFGLWIKLPQKIRFLFVGGYNTVFSYLLYVVFVYVGMTAQLALLLSFLISSINSYLTQKFYVFLTRGNYLKEYVKCLVTWMGSYVLNAALLFVLMKFVGLNAYFAEFVVLVLLTIYSFVVLKYFAFKTIRK